MWGTYILANYVAVCQDLILQIATVELQGALLCTGYRNITRNMVQWLPAWGEWRAEFVWFKTDSDGKNLIKTENQDEAILSIKIDYNENKAVMALAGDIDKNIPCA